MQAFIIINIEHQYQSFTTSYKILSYSNEQSCLDIGIRNRPKCQSLLGNYSSGWRVWIQLISKVSKLVHVQANSLQLCCPCSNKGCPLLSTRIQSYFFAFHRKTGSVVVYSSSIPFNTNRLRWKSIFSIRERPWLPVRIIWIYVNLEDLNSKITSRKPACSSLFVLFLLVLLRLYTFFLGTQDLFNLMPKWLPLWNNKYSQVDPSKNLCFGYSALIDVKRNFEQTNLYFTLIENPSKN